MNAVISLVMIALRVVSSDIPGECDMAAFYLELGCQPVWTTTDLCPNKFKCPRIEDRSKCSYKGEVYVFGEVIPQDRIGNPCLQSCSCKDTKIECATVDCPEEFDSDNDHEQCIMTYEVNSCCADRKVCGQESIDQLETCVHDGSTYLEGQLFYIPNTVKSCICTGDWDNGIQNRTYCWDIECGIELLYGNSIAEKCAPVFVNTYRGCPIGFECPSADSKVIKGWDAKQERRGRCKFGNMTLTIGDELTIGLFTRCKCTVPPLVQCIKSYN